MYAHTTLSDLKHEASGRRLEIVKYEKDHNVILSVAGRIYHISVFVNKMDRQNSVCLPDELQEYKVNWDSSRRAFSRKIGSFKNIYCAWERSFLDVIQLQL